MDFFFPDRVIAIAHSGDNIGELRAQFSKPGEILVHGDGVRLSPGDKITRKLSNGIEEHYEILDAHYSPSGISDLPSTTTLQVRKSGSMSGFDRSPHITVSGPGARVNYQSVDASANIVHVNSDDVFQNLLDTLATIQTSDRQVLISAAQELRTNAGSPQYAASFKNFISLASSVTPLIAPFIPELAKLLQS